MYVYDEANNLAKAIQESREYLEFKKAKEDVSKNPEMKTKIDEFEKTRYEVQEYFDIEVRFNIMLADVNKIISESVKDLL